MSVSKKQQLQDRIREVGLRVTDARLLVLQILARSKAPLSHRQVAEKLQGNIDQATTYRNLVKLESSGLIFIASRVAGIARYAYSNRSNDHCHPHFTCSDCGVTECVPDARLRITSSSKWSKSVKEADLQLVGICPNCRE